MAEGDDGKTEDPTGKKLGEARSEGMVAKSADLSSAILLLSGTLLLGLFANWFGHRFQEAMILCFQAIPRFDQLVGDLPRLTLQGYVFILKLIIPFTLTLAVISVAANLVQYGPLWAGKSMEFKLSRIFSAAGLLKFFSTGPLISIPKNLVKMGAVGLMAYWVVVKHYPASLALADQSPRQIVDFILSASKELLIKCSALLVIIGLADFVYNKREYKKKLMMTKHEVKDEMKAAEGDPRIKGKIKTLRRQLYGKMMMHELPKATVVITNPTFIAIALRYEQGRDTAPRVVAKGKRLLAERIRDMARSHDIPIVEDKPLARGLFETAEVGEEIPAEFFAVVAEILATVFSLSHSRTAQTAA